MEPFGYDNNIDNYPINMYHRFSLNLMSSRGEQTSGTLIIRFQFARAAPTKINLRNIRFISSPCKMTTEYKEILKHSGNKLHAKVAHLLRDKGWETSISPYYVDSQTNKCREIDLIARKEFKINDHCSPLQKNFKILKVQLFVECKNVPKETLFWFDKRDEKKSLEKAVEISQFSEGNTNLKELHILREPSVAKLFSSSDDVKKQTDTEPFFQAINQVLHSVIFWEWQKKKSLVRDNNHTISYPVIVCDSFDKIAKTDLDTETIELLKDKDFFNIETDYNYNIPGREASIRQYFLTDIVNFKKIDDYLESIATDNDVLCVTREALKH